MAKKKKLNIHKTAGRVTAVQELNSLNFVYKLGDSPAYVHSYNRYMKVGTRIATTEFHRNVTQIIDQIKQIIGRWMLILQSREQELYNLLNITNFEQFQNQIWPAILSGKLGNNPSSIGEGLDKAINVQNAIWDIRLAEADKKPNVIQVAQKLNETLQQFAVQVGGFDVLKTMVNSPNEIELIKDDGTVAFGRDTMLKNVAKNMGFAVEHVLGGLAQEQAIQFINNALNNTKVSAKHVGTQVNRGAADVEFLFGKNGITFTLGATVKMRRVAKKNADGK
nr:MAG TPA: hypothetical protein [Caudoviricetes sp.]